MANCSCPNGNQYGLPRNYLFKRFLGSGTYGSVLECFKKDTKRSVAVKVPNVCDLNNEFILMEYFKLSKVDKTNIVHFVETFITTSGKTALVFEKLDVDLGTYVYEFRDCYLEIHEIRSFIKQMATALSALKELRVIHADIKCNNIMLEDSNKEPLTLKLIDFGMAFPTYRRKHGQILQLKDHRAPEIYLGLPFSEAIDMWSLGVIMGSIILRDNIFGWESEFEVMSNIVNILGVPDDHLLRAGLYSTKFFVETSSNNWRLKTEKEYGRISPPVSKQKYSLRNLDDIATLPLKNLSKATADEKMELIDLLKAMLQIDPEKRITPSQVLAHPFITRGSLHRDSDTEGETTGTTTLLSPGVFQPTKDPRYLPWEKILETIIYYQPSSSKSYWEKAILASSNESGPNELMQSEANPTSSVSALPSEVVMVQPAPPEKCLHLDEDNVEQSKAYPTSSESVQPSGVVMVQPAPPEKCLHLDEDDVEQSEAYPTSSESALFSGVIMVQPAPPEKCLHLDEDDVEQSEACTLDQPEDGLEERPFSTGTFIIEHREPGTTSDIIQDQAQKKKKKKNCFKRFSSWLKKTFSCRVSPIED